LVKEHEPPPSRVLIVEDDPRIHEELERLLQDAGFVVLSARGVRDAEQCLQQQQPDLVLLDLGLPDGDGIDFCRRLRKEDATLPVIMLTARDSPDQRVLGLDAGADDYVVKPFHPEEVLARVRSVFRRTRRDSPDERVQFGPLWADPVARRAGFDDAEIDLTRREFDLFLFLLQNPDRAWTRDQLFHHVWKLSGSVGASRTIDLHMRKLRLKVEPDPASPQWLRTVWGVGYALQTEGRDE
jgi:DNA-binding response OmpR family regulator